MGQEGGNMSPGQISGTRRAAGPALGQALPIVKTKAYQLLPVADRSSGILCDRSRRRKAVPVRHHAHAAISGLISWGNEDAARCRIPRLSVRISLPGRRPESHACRWATPVWRRMSYAVVTWK